MSLRMEPSDDPKTITFQLEGKWAASDLLELSERCNQMLDEMTYRVDMIGDLSQAATAALLFAVVPNFVTHCVSASSTWLA